MSPRNKQDQSLWRQNLARSHLLRREHTDLLATPNWRRVKKTDPNINNEFWKIPKATLKASPTERTGMLAEPKKRPKPEDDLIELPMKIDPATLNAKCKDRVKLLAISKRPKLIVQKELFKDLLGESFVERMEKYLKEREDNMWQPEPREIYLGPSHEVKRFDSKSWAKYKRKNLRLIAKPKTDWSALKTLPKSKKAPLDDLLIRILELCVPPKRYTKKPPPDPPTVQPGALEYEATERVKELSVPRKFYKPDPGPPCTAAGVSIAALQCQPGEKYDALATPRDRRHAPEVDVRENPFDVSPLALKYVITPRMAKLAQPVERSTS